MGKRKFTDGQIEEMRMMHVDKGMSYKAMAYATGVPGSTIFRHINDDTKKTDAAYRKTHAEERQSYNDAHKREKRLYDIDYRALNKDKRSAYNRSDKRKALQRDWQKNYLPARAARQAARRALIAGATIGNLAEIASIYRRAQETPRVRCYLCGKLIEKGHRHVDHIMPLAKGGMHRPSNLAVACDTCNWHKNAKLPEEIGVLI